MVHIPLPHLVRAHSHAALLFVGLAGASFIGAIYAIAQFVQHSREHIAQTQSIATISVAAVCATLALAVSQRWVVSEGALELTAGAGLCGLFGVTLVEIANEPVLFGSATARCCLIVVVAGIVIHSRAAVIVLAGLAITSWLLVITVADIPTVESNRWWPTWFITAAAAMAAHAMASAERGVEAGVRRDAEEESWTDALTGLVNRRGFRQQALPVVALAHRNHQSLWCAFIDLDYFKQVNDQVGHDAGDEVLVALANALRKNARAADVLARWGGDEFVLLGVGPQPSEGEIEQRLSRSLAALPTPITSAWTPGVTVGAVTEHMSFDRAEGLDDALADLLTAADRRMYQRRKVARTPAAQG